MNKKNITKKGFSIGEVMIAMFILVTGIIGAVFLSAKSTAQIGDSRNAIIAASLAQEGVELVRNIRDNSVTQETCGTGESERCTAFEAYAGTASNQGNSYGWPTWDLGRNGVGCIVDYTMENETGMVCSNISDLQSLYLDPQSGFYRHGTGDTTPFKRIIFIKYYDINTSTALSGITDAELAAKVTSVVTWSDDVDLELNNIDDVEANCKIGKQCAYAQTTLTSWINFE